MSVVAIIGEGKLADCAGAHLSACCELIRQSGFEAGVPHEADLALVLADDWRPDDFEQAERLLRQAGKPWLGAFVSFREGVIGPLVRPGKPGCSQCASARRLAGGYDFGGDPEPLMSLFAQGVVPRDPSVSEQGIVQMSYIVAREARRVLEGGPARTGNGIYRMDLATLETTLHKFLPNPRCPHCGGIPDDSPEAARIALKPSMKVDTRSHRARALTGAFADTLAERYIDERTGILRSRQYDLITPFAMTSVAQPSANGAELTAGRGHSYAQCGHTAMLEGLERYCSTMAQGKRTVVEGSYRMFADRALDPRTVGLYGAEMYGSEDFEFEPYDVDLELNWVWGYSFARESPILVPEQLAYYSASGGGRFVTENSNGCALGGSLEEAILYGMLEAAERDAFLMAWYARLPLPRLDPESAGDPELSQIVSRLREIAGYEALLFNSTMENNIPTVLAILKNAKPTGANLICAASSHLDPVRAAKNALLEASGHIHFLSERLELDRDEIALMLDDPSAVSLMEDHALLYSHPMAEHRLSFLLESSAPPRTFGESFEARERSADLTDDLIGLIAGFRDLGLDVIVVEQTAPEVAEDGLHVVKTLIPGLLPMTFGHRLRRWEGLERLYRIPMALGYAKQPLTAEHINPHPHPFF